MNLKKVEKFGTFSFTMYTEYDIIILESIKGESIMKLSTFKKRFDERKLVNKISLALGEDFDVSVEPYYRDARESIGLTVRISRKVDNEVILDQYSFFISFDDENEYDRMEVLSIVNRPQLERLAKFGPVIEDYMVDTF